MSLGLLPSQSRAQSLWLAADDLTCRRSVGRKSSGTMLIFRPGAGCAPLPVWT